ncbi:MAG: hypothetical protein VSS75_022865, partial [Candidatus Parabeggiatoa sp.]|nr:hypothetical protein [Candidatus Parabeggiatoa sp.]
VSMARVFVSTFAKNFQLQRSNPFWLPFAVKYLFICGSGFRQRLKAVGCWLSNFIIATLGRC